MATKIRLQRHGRKGYAYYHIVVSDSRAPRDGKFIERLGAYNPNTNPATIDLNFERALYWVQVGAQPTDTTRNILSGEGVMMKNHLLGGVKKGAFSLEEAEAKFEAWKQGKDSSLNAIRVSLKDAERAENKKRLEAEVALNKAKADEISNKLAAAKAEEAAANAPVVEEVAPIAEETAPVVEEVAPITEEVAVIEEVAPVTEEVAVIEEVAPIAEASAPVAKEVAPIAEETAVVVEEVAPIAEASAPVAKEVAPVAKEKAPKA